MASNLGVTVDLCMVYMLMLVSMTLMQGHSGSAKAKNRLNYFDIKASNKHYYPCCNGRPFFM